MASKKWWLEYSIREIKPDLTDGKATEKGKLEADTYEELQDKLRDLYHNKVYDRSLTLDHGGIANAPSGKRSDRRRISVG
jgi:hypothetical protein